MKESLHIKKHILWFLGLVLLVFIADRSIAFGLEQILQKSNSRFIKMYNGGLKNDFIFVGDSRGVTSFYQPQIEAITKNSAFNISTSGITVGLCKEVLADYFRLNKKPKTVFVEVSMLRNVNINDVFLDNLKIFYDKSEGLGKLAKKRMSASSLVQNIFHTNKFNNVMFFKMLSYLSKDDQAEINRYTIKPFLIEETKNRKPFTLKVRDGNLESLRAIVDLCKTEEVEVKLVLGPFLPDYINKVSNLKEWIENIEKATGHKVYNYSNAIQKELYFADRLHMNEKGAIEFAQIMKDNNLFD